MISQLVLQTIAMMITVGLIPRLKITSFIGAFLIVVALSVINSTIWHAGLFFSIPLALSKHAVLVFLANGVIFWLLVKLLPGVEVQGIFPALIAPLVFTITSALVFAFLKDVNWVNVLGLIFNSIKGVGDALYTHHGS